MSLEILERVGTIQYDGTKAPVSRVRCSECGNVYERRGSRTTIARAKSCFDCHVRLRKQPAHGKRGRFVGRRSP